MRERERESANERERERERESANERMRERGKGRLCGAATDNNTCDCYDIGWLRLVGSLKI